MNGSNGFEDVLDEEQHPSLNTLFFDPRKNGPVIYDNPRVRITQRYAPPIYALMLPTYSHSIPLTGPGPMIEHIP